MIFLSESNFNDVEILSEAASDGKKFWYVQGVHAQANVVNKNRRIYPKDILKESIDEYIKEYVDTSRAIGELTHPANTQINLDRVTHLITNIREDGDSWYGKARVLDTPCGKIVQGLLEGGVKLGVSTRANGTVKKNRQGIDEVQRGLKMSAVDIVANPSAPDAFVEGLMESAEFVWDTMNVDHQFLIDLKEDFSKKRSSQLQEAKFEAFKKLMQHIRA